jgi:hypothetical protein
MSACDVLALLFLLVFLELHHYTLTNMQSSILLILQQCWSIVGSLRVDIA